MIERSRLIDASLTKPKPSKEFESLYISRIFDRELHQLPISGCEIRTLDTPLDLGISRGDLLLRRDFGYTQTVERAPDNALALRDLGAVYLESGDDAKARTALEKAAALAPKDGDTHFQLVRLYNRIGETALAKKHQEIFQSIRGAWGKAAQ